MTLVTNVFMMIVDVVDVGGTLTVAAWMIVVLTRPSTWQDDL